MSFQHEITQAGVGSSPVFKPNTNLLPFQITLQTVVTGTVTYTVEYTKDNVHLRSYDPSAGNWVGKTGMVDATGNVEGTFISPVTGIRVVQSAGSGSVVLQIVQAGDTGLTPQVVT